MNNRQIKFRAWDETRKGFVPAEELILGAWPSQSSENVVWFLETEEQHDDELGGTTLPTTGYVLQQFTGLLDKNGKEIYEGDLFRGCGSNTNDVFHLIQALPLTRTAWSYIERVGWFDGKKYHSLGKRTQTDITYDEALSFAEETEVIGNIYENPELLKP